MRESGQKRTETEESREEQCPKALRSKILHSEEALGTMMQGGMGNSIKHAFS